jgi:predicted Zn-dependent protease
LYLSNLHYLNWSDNDSGRITGMTRFACVWVEDGRIVAPIKDMRFDESIYHLLGDKLLDLTSQRSLIPNTGSYFKRDLGGSLLPGILAEDFTFTL